MKKTHPWAIVGIIVTTVFTSFGQLLWKIGADQMVLEVTALLTNWPLIFGFVLYGLGALIMVVSLKYGELSVLFPFVALSFIWVSLLSVGLLGEVMTLTNWGGVASIIAGVSLIGWGAER